MSSKISQDDYSYSSNTINNGRFCGNTKRLISMRHKWIIAFLVFIVIILLLVVILQANSEAPLTEQSITFISSSDVVRSLNTSIDPCTNMWSFTCGGWIKNNPLQDNRGSFSVRDQLKRQINRDVRDYIDLIEADEDHWHKPEWKVTQLYKLCMDYTENNADVFIHKISTDFAGWTALKKFTKAKWSFQESLETLLIKYGVSGFFSMTADNDNTKNGTSIIKIEPSGLGLPHRDFYFDAQYDSAYRHLIKDVAIKLNVTPKNADQFVESVVSFERRLANITPSVRELHSPDKYQNMQVQDLNKIISRVKWTHLLHRIYKNGNIKSSTYVLVAFPRYFLGLEELLSSVNSTTANNYVVWKLLLTYLPYINRDLYGLHQQFLRRMKAVPKYAVRPTTEKWEFCIETVTKFLGHAVGAIYINSRMKAESTAISEVTKMVDVMSLTLLKKVDSFSLTRDTNLSNITKQKIMEMKRTIGVGQSRFALNMKNIEKYYDDFEVSKDYLGSIIEGFKFMRKFEHHSPDAASTIMSWTINPTDVATRYNVAENTLLIVSGMFGYPFYEHDVPMSIKFGALVFQFALKMLRSLSSFRLSSNDTGGERCIVSHETWRAYNNSVSCLIDNINNHQPINSEFHVDASLVVPQTFSDVLALQLVYDSYKKYISEYGNDKSPNEVGKSNEQLLFISISQSMCETVRPEYARAHYKSITTLPAQQRIELLLRQVKQFQSAFGCNNNYEVCGI